MKGKSVPTPVDEEKSETGTYNYDGHLYAFHGLFRVRMFFEAKRVDQKSRFQSGAEFISSTYQGLTLDAQKLSTRFFITESGILFGKAKGKM